MKLRDFHRISATFIAAFVFLHLANHLASLAGVSAHISFMEFARKLYRHPMVEYPLLFCVAFQIISGLWFVIGGWRQRRGKLTWLQAISGAAMALFLLVHVSAVLYGRAVQHLDTNFYFAAAGFYVPPNQYFFGPYYFLSVLAFFTHLGCATYWQMQQASQRWQNLAIAAPIFIGSVISLLIVLSLAGKIQTVEIPAAYTAAYIRSAK